MRFILDILVGGLAFIIFEGIIKPVVVSFIRRKTQPIIEQLITITDKEIPFIIPKGIKATRVYLLQTINNILDKNNSNIRPSTILQQYEKIYSPIDNALKF